MQPNSLRYAQGFHFALGARNLAFKIAILVGYVQSSQARVVIGNQRDVASSTNVSLGI